MAEAKLTVAGRTRKLKEQILAFLEKDDNVQALCEMLMYKALNEHDVVAARELLDRGLGKATEKMEVTGPGGMPIEHAHLIIDYSKFKDEELDLLADMARRAVADRNAGSSEVIDSTATQVTVQPLLPAGK